MRKLYIADISLLSGEKEYNDYFSRIDQTRQEKAEKYKFKSDKKRSILAGYLIQTGVKEESGLQEDSKPLSLSYIYGRDGKPYLKDYPKLFFSLSHSGDYVVCAFSDKEIGVDIQKHEGMDREIADRFYSAKDKEALDMCKNNGSFLSEEAMFYRIWAVKEAHMKLTGNGIKQGFDKTYLAFKDSRLADGSVKETNEEGCLMGEIQFGLVEGPGLYSLAICGYSEIKEIQVIRVGGLAW